MIKVKDTDYLYATGRVRTLERRLVTQRDLRRMLDSKTVAEAYKVLTDAGIEFTMPRGAFYFFPKSPVADEAAFIQALVEERVLAVPGRGFGCPGYARFAFCVDTKVIEGARQSIKNAVKKLK